MSEPVYEMMWDCPRCDTPKLLGVTHRYCPNCGSPQDPDKRYFPPDDEKVAVQDHVYVGRDRVCPGCDTPNSAASKHCASCGAALEGDARDARLVSEQPEAERPPAPPPAAKKGGGGKAALGCGAVILGLVVLAAIAAVVAMLWTRESSATVAGHSWSRTIEVEQYGRVEESDWCDKAPRGATVKQRTTKQRSTKTVSDGEDCRTKKVDQGDGTFKEVQDCKPKTKEVGVDDDWCTYDVEKWSTSKTLEAKGASLSPEPSWPKANLQTCTSVKTGCQREGKKVQRYVVKLKSSDGATDECVVDQARWASMAVGSTWKAKQRVLTSGLDCDSLSAAK